VTTSNFTGKTYLVIGGDGGLGGPTVSALEAGGATVHQMNRDRVDLRSRDVLARAITAAWQLDGPFDGLVHAAGLFPAHAVLDATESMFDEVLTVNARSALIATVSIAQLAVQANRECQIVLISSGAGTRPRVGTVTYAASKAAVDAIVRGTALELGASRIRVNAVAPGFVQVSSQINPIPNHYISELAAASFQGRVAVAEDVVPLVLWLLSSASAWVTGQTIAIDGGSSLGTVAGPSWLAT